MSQAPRAGSDPLPIKRVEFLGGMAALPDSMGKTTEMPWRPAVALPEVAFAGRSNVGKSSLLNALVRRRAIARVSRTPGRTREINFFAVNDEFVLVDLPGYGYARVAKSARAAWRPLIENYLRETRTLRGLVLLLDVRREPTTDDLQMLEFLAERRLPVMVVITKIDKLSSSMAAERIAALTNTLGLNKDQVVPFSAVTGEGRDELAAAVVALVRP
ncbi:MAG TPA: ribosome biogenesis GTP-binding protein YihA/YsxC [Gemmatimonadaceae bacterium]|nr:ribosome biogenesis GTP-binding protein YihA/YsxC [Gemmatimonadaceae bacterium]